MSKRGYFSRYSFILKKLNAKTYSSYEEILSFVNNELEHLQILDDTIEIGFSKRTFQRDIVEIRNSFGIEIQYSRTFKGYYIKEKERESKSFQRMMEAFDVFNSLNLAHDLSPFLHLETRRPQGTESLLPLMQAIKNNVKISFVYTKFWEEDSSKRLAIPYALKEFKNRWYLLAKDENNKMKSFAIDRISDLVISNIKVDKYADFDVDEHYRYCFGIISPNDTEVEEIILSFTSFQGKYIKTLPLHETQEILIDTEEELQIKLKLNITHDLIMELLSFGNNMRVIQPQSLRDRIQEDHRKAFEQY